MSAVNLDKAIGFESTPIATAWTQRDILLYTVGIGGKSNELQWVNELTPGWHAFPTYPLVLPFKGDEASVVDFALTSKTAGGINPHMPAINPNNFVHASQSIEILKQIPATSKGNEGWKIIKKLVGLKDTGKGLIIDTIASLYSPDGTEYVRMASSAYAFGKYGGNGFNKSIAPALPVLALAKPPTREPDVVFTEKTSDEQAILYRLSGDYNQLHIDPSIGAKLGFGGVISHGLIAYGFAARALCSTIGAGDATRLTYMSARFTSPVLPGQTMETKMWVSKEGGKIRVDFVEFVRETGKMVLGGGVALLRDEGATKL